MNSKQIQFNRQGMAALLFAVSILAATAGLIWAGVDANVNQPKWAAGSEKADSVEYDSRLSPLLHLRSVKGGAAGGIVGSKR